MASTERRILPYRHRRPLADPTKTSSSFTTKLSAELRLKVYTYLLRSCRRLKRASTPKLRSQLFNTAILTTCKLVHKEAIESLYDDNVFEVPLQELCSHCNTDMANHPLFDRPVYFLILALESCKDCCRLMLASYISAALLGKPKLSIGAAKLNHLAVRIYDYSFPAHALGSLLPGFHVRFGSVGGFAVGLHPGQYSGLYSVVCQYPSIVSTWAYVATILPAELDEATLAQRLKQRPDIDTGVAAVACSQLKSHYEDQRNLTGVVSGQMRCWAERRHSQRRIELHTWEMAMRL